MFSVPGQRICTTADLQRELLKEEAKQMDDPCAFRSCYLNPGGLLEEVGLVTIDLPIPSYVKDSTFISISGNFPVTVGVRWYF